MAIKAVFFDMDGTIVNSIVDLAVATNYALKQKGYPEKEVEEYNDFQGSGARVMIERALAPIVLPKDEMDELLALFSDYYEKNATKNTTVYEGISELIAELRNMGIKVGCVTNKIENIANDIINTFFGGMDVVVGQVEGKPTKPDPAGTLFALEQLNINKDECLFVGDTNVDINTGKNAGIKSVGVEWGFRTREELEAAGADYIVKNPQEVLNIIENNC